MKFISSTMKVLYHCVKQNQNKRESVQVVEKMRKNCEERRELRSPERQRRRAKKVPPSSLPSLLAEAR